MLPAIVAVVVAQRALRSFAPALRDEGR